MTSLTGLTKNNLPATLVAIMLVLLGFVGVLRGAERRFKQALLPAHILSYFVKTFPPNYPDTALTQHKKDNGLFRLTIDRPTGKVTDLKVLKSTGVKIFDDSAATAFLQWKAKSNRIHDVVIPVSFVAWD